jgi:hypothetical protein
MREAVSVTDQHVGLDCYLFEGPQKRRRFTEGEQARHIGKRRLAAKGGGLLNLQGLE